MGTAKKLVLASVFSMMLVLAFMVGFMPSHDAETTGAAGGDGRVDMAGLLDMIVGGEKAITEITPLSKLKGVTVMTPQANAGTPYMPLSLRANAPGAADEDVFYTVNSEAEVAASFVTDANGLPLWQGPLAKLVGVATDGGAPVIADPDGAGPRRAQGSSTLLPSTYPGVFDISSLVGGPGLTNYLVNALVVADNVYGLYQGGPGANLYYDLKSATALPFSVNVVSNLFDGNVNGVPDLYTYVNDGSVWVASIDTGLLDGDGNPIIRTVVVANLADLDLLAKAAGDSVTLEVRDDVTVEVPTLASFVDAGLVAEGSDVLAVIQVVDDLSGVLDVVDGDDSAAALQAWADAVRAAAPGEIVDAPIVDIAFVVDTNTSPAPFQLTDIAPLSATLSVANVVYPEMDGNASLGIFGIPTAVADNVYSDVPGAQWHDGDPAPVLGADSYVATLSSFSAFVPVVSNIRIDSVDPAVIPENVSVPMILTGVFPTGKAATVYYDGLSVDEATAKYNVYINGAKASFRAASVVYTTEGGGDEEVLVAVTELDAAPGATNQMFINSPAIDLQGAKALDVDVLIEYAENPGSFYLLPASVEVGATGVVTLTYSGTGTGVTNLTPASGSIVVDGETVTFPAGTFFVGTQVTAEAVPAVGSLFQGFMLDGAPLEGDVFTVNADAVLDTEFASESDTFSLTITPPVNGAIVANPVEPVGGYAINTVVTLTATADVNFLFQAWTGDPVNVLSATATQSVAQITMNADKTVGATFVPDVTPVFTLTVLPTVNGVINVAPPQPVGGYPQGTVVTATAVADSGFQFDAWTDDLAGNPNSSATLTMDANKTIGADFSEIPPVDLNLTSIAPAEAWIFGGVTAKITGTGLSLNTKFTIGGKTVWGFSPAPDGTSIEVLIPASDDNTVNALVITSVTAQDGAVTAPVPLPFTYKRYFTDAQGRNTTAFILNSPADENQVKLTTGNNTIDKANLIIPGLDTSAARVFGIAMSQKLSLATAKATTAPVPTGSLAASLINETDQGLGIEGAYDFSLYLYTEPTAKTTGPVGTTPPADSQLPFYLDASAELVNFDPTVDPDDAMKLTFPLDDSPLNYADVRTGLTMWGIEGQFNYVNNVESISDPKVVAYQSSLLSGEVDPAMLPVTPDADEPDQVLKARLYSLNGFSLRKGAALPADVAAAIRLAKVDGTAVSGTGKGSVKGGTVLTLVSPLGGIGYIDRIVMKDPNKLFNRELGGTATESLFVTKNGVDEYLFEFKTPKSQKAGIVDIVIYLKSNPDTPAAVLPKTFEYTKQGINFLPILLALLGLAIAIIGIAAGGDSGGGGGGPCFIASAAYGTPMAAQIDTLRAVRDTYLLDNALGTAFVDAYYRVSPAIADVVAQSPVLAALVRLLLVPALFVGKLALVMPVPAALVALAAMAALVLRRRARRA